MIGVLVSGEGSNLQALLDAGLPVCAVASNRARVRALERAAAAGVPGAAFELSEFADSSGPFERAHAGSVRGDRR